MTMLDTFLTALVASLIVGILALVGVLCFLFSDLGFEVVFALIMFFLAGAAIGVFTTLIICLGRKEPQG